MDRAELIARLKAADVLLERSACKSFKSFVQVIHPAYDMQWFHAVICDKLQAFYNREIKNLMILMIPQSGKSELATRKFPAWVLGRDPGRRIAIASYAQSIASSFNRAIQRNIDNEVYGRIFPNTRLNNSPIFGTNAGPYSRTDKLIEVINNIGNV